MKRNTWLRPGLIAGGIIIGLVLACVLGFGIFTMTGRYAANDAAEGARDLMSSGAAPQPQIGAQKLVEQEIVAASEAPMPAEPPGLAYAAERLIIRTGNISMVVEDTRAAQATIASLVAAMAGEGAFVVSSEEYGGTEGSQPHVAMSIRIPAARFDETMDRLADLAVNVTSRSESAQDVTEEYVDLEARLESLEAARQRLLEIMQEARATKDLLEAEQQLTQREAEIESIKGRMQYLEQSARLSSIWIDLQPYVLSQPLGDNWRPAETARRAVDALLAGLRGFGNFAIFFTIAILPWLIALGLLIALVVALIRRLGRRRRAHGDAASEAPDQQDSSR